MKRSALSWVAPIIPSVSLGGIELGINLDELDNLLEGHSIDQAPGLYKFESSPILALRKSISGGDIIYVFNVFDRELTNWRLYFNSPDHAGANPRALGVVIRNGVVHAVKVWDFENVKEGDKPKHVYAGKLPEGIGLGDPIGDLLVHAKLNYDDAEEVYYTDASYGGLEVSGVGNLDDFPEQSISCLAVIGGAGG